jgi:hypothetical protein
VQEKKQGKQEAINCIVNPPNSLESCCLKFQMYVDGLISNFKPCLVVKFNDIQVPTTKKGLQSGFGRVKFENPTPWEVLQCISK